ncbi:hypothetical protein OCK02_24355 [Rhizobium sp. TRM96647]|uniref:hypothetical protein n=1 Tax=unclassified Rhizobium TaxID=2613769 RepID=UPI0021E8861B|nr:MULTISPECIES: hypothetical protein [unclassified Rhizobium]MCV3739306.1 hypothetical protein [Rhizobium sp. TRM96647]MCV3760944.1 hypothetical protein [Rhizobium sp. TRM96650]
MVETPTRKVTPTANTKQISRFRRAAAFRQLRPARITGAADSDPSAISSRAGAVFGFNKLCTMVSPIPG